MAEWEKNGYTYRIKQPPLTPDELKATEDGSRYTSKYIQDLLAGRQPDKDLLNKQPSYWLKMVEATVSKCFGITDEELSERKMKAGDLFDLFDTVITYSKGWHKL